GRWLAAHGGLRPRRATRREITRQRYPLYQNRYAAVQQRRPWILGLGLVLRITVGRAPAFRRRLGIPEPTARAEPRHGSGPQSTGQQNCQQAPRPGTQATRCRPKTIVLRGRV